MPRPLQSMDAAIALGSAIKYLEVCKECSDYRHVTEEINDTIKRLQEILDQKGCNHFDPYCRKDGLLTSLIDVIIDG